MEIQNKAIQVLDKQIFEVQSKINQTKIDIANAFIKAIGIDIQSIKTAKDVMPIIENAENMSQYLDIVKAQEKILAVLNKSREEIQQQLQAAS